MLKFNSLRPDVKEYLKEMSQALKENKSKLGAVYFTSKDGCPEMFQDIAFKDVSTEDAPLDFSESILDQVSDSDRKLIEDFEKAGHGYFIVAAGTLK